jgi:hypothetical protein
MRYEFTEEKEKELYQDLRSIHCMTWEEIVERYNEITCGCYRRSFDEWHQWHQEQFITWIFWLLQGETLLLPGQH